MLHLLQKKDKKHRDPSHGSSKQSKSSRAENGDVSKVIKEETVVTGGTHGNQEVDVASVSSGISDSKSFTSDMEMIPLNSISNNRNNMMASGPTLTITTPSSHSIANTRGGGGGSGNESNNDDEDDETSDLSDGDPSTSKPLIANSESNGTTDSHAAISV